MKIQAYHVHTRGGVDGPAYYTVAALNAGDAARLTTERITSAGEVGGTVAKVVALRCPHALDYGTVICIGKP